MGTDRVVPVGADVVSSQAYAFHLDVGDFQPLLVFFGGVLSTYSQAP